MPNDACQINLNSDSSRDWAEEFIAEKTPSSPEAPRGFPPSLELKARYQQNQDSDSLRVSLAEALSGAHKHDLSEMREIAEKGWASLAGSASHAEILILGPPSAQGDRVRVVGPRQNSPLRSTKSEQVRTLAGLALSEKSRHDARRTITTWLPSLDDAFRADASLTGVASEDTSRTRHDAPGQVAGVLNEGLFDDAKFVTFASKFPPPPQSDQSSSLITDSADGGLAYFKSLGHRVSTADQRDNAYALIAESGTTTIATAVFCESGEAIRRASKRLNGETPHAYAVSAAKKTGSPWAIVVRYPELWLYPVDHKTAVGGGGREEAAAAINLSLLGDDALKFAHMLFSAAALKPGGHLDQLLDESRAFAVDVGNGLRERIYDRTVPKLAEAVARRLQESTDDITREDLAEAYEQVMLILFRTLFLAYGEHKGILPLNDNYHYRQNSLAAITNDILETRRRGDAYLSDSTVLWDSVNRLWAAICEGNADWGVPGYGGGLFSADESISRAGAGLANLAPLTDREFGPALEAVLTSSDFAQSGAVEPNRLTPVDFGSLSVREFGTIYEGLLESELDIAPVDLTLKKRKREQDYVPATDGAEAVCPKGAVYFRHRSGTRKSTGSYFTKPFAVSHLLDKALETALDHHIERLDRLKKDDGEQAASEAFFDFRCADIAMGSGHFLIAAIDRITARLAGWLSENPLPAIARYLDSLREASQKTLGDEIDITDGRLLSRQVARHCIYGVDINRVAVELARLAVWLHTFVPGLPLSLLDHNLVHGDSLTGVGTLEEADAALASEPDPDRPSLAGDMARAALNRCGDEIRRIASIPEAGLNEIGEIRQRYAAVREATRVLRAACDAVTAHRASACELPESFDEKALIRFSEKPEVVAAVQELNPLHFPAAFPEVFLRERPGFDCLIGNPPWEQVVVQEHVWWGMHLPGIRGQSVNKMNTAIEIFRRQRPDLEAAFGLELDRAERMRSLLRRVFEGMGSGRTDLYQAFAWRNLGLTAEGGQFGLVLPNTATQAAGMTNWRQKTVGIEDMGRDNRAERRPRITVATLINHKGWAFEGVHNSYTVALATVTRSSRLSPASTPSSGHSTTSTVGTRSPSSQHASAAAQPSHGGGFETSADEPHVAVYPGPARSLAHFRTLVDGKPELVPVAEFQRWSDSLAFPQLPSRAAFRVWRRMKQHPRLDGADVPSRADPPNLASPASPGRPQRDQRQASLHPRQWRVRPFAELHATFDKKRFVLDDGTAARTANSTPPTTRPGS